MLAALLLLSCSLVSPPPPQVLVIVERGDTLGEIAKDHGVTVAQIMEWNDLQSDLIEIGQPLVLMIGAPAAPTSSPQPRTRRGKRSGTASSRTPSSPPLSMPSPKHCLGGPDVDDLSADDGAIVSTGLDRSQIRTAMNAFMPKLAPCLKQLDTSPSGALTLSISVGCDGRVTGITVQGREDWPEDSASCIVDTLAFTPFPAHALPDGDTFVYPLRMQ